MVVKKFPKSKQGSVFRLEVAHVHSPEVVPSPPRIGEAAKLETNVLGFPAGTDVTFSVYEPFKLHEGAVEELTAQTVEEHRGVEVDWNFDYEGKKADLSGARFVVVARCGNMLGISEPFEFVQTFEMTLKDEDDEPLAETQVVLRAPGRDDVYTQTDGEGKISVDVPPADYIVDIVSSQRDGSNLQVIGDAATRIDGKLLQGSGGTVVDQVNAGVVYKYWSVGRARWGDEVELGALISGWPDGTAVKLKLYEKDEGDGENDDPVTEIDGSIDKGLVHATYKIEFEDPDGDEGDEYEFYFLVEIDGEVKSWREMSPVLFVDLTLPLFSE